MAAFDYLPYIPNYVRHALILGNGGEELGQRLHERSKTHVVFTRESGQAPYDFIMDLNSSDWSNDPARRLQEMRDLLVPQGLLLLLTNNALYWDKKADEGISNDDFIAQLTAANMALYEQWADGSVQPPETFARRDTYSDADWEALTTQRYLTWVVRATYDPLVHARECYDAQQYDRAHDILITIPLRHLPSSEVKASVFIFVLETLLRWDESSTVRDLSMRRLRLARQALSVILVNTCEDPRVYALMTEFFLRYGALGEARKTVAIGRRIAPSRDLDRCATRLPTEEPRHIGKATLRASIHNSQFNRVLFITNNRADYGLDLIYDGLCGVLGAENVVEYPWKPTLHGIYDGPSAYFDYYPCNFRHPGKPKSLEQIETALQDNAFDLVLWGDTPPSLEVNEARRIVAAAKGIPVVLVDQSDELDDYSGEMRAYLNGIEPLCYFKRELCHFANFGSRCFPLPFSYATDRLPRSLPKDRPHSLFWAGARGNGFRPAYLSHLEAVLNASLDTLIPQQNYVRLLQASRIGLCLAGGGYDTVRYWEVPAHGCLLLAENTPQVIPNNFQDGVSAAIFSSFEELDERLAYFAHHHDEARAIAERGHALLKEHHTSQARAAQCLHQIRQIMGKIG